MNRPSSNAPTPKLEVSDLPAASFILAIGGKLIGIRRGDGSRVIFQFVAANQETLLRFYSGDDRVSARALFAAYRDLKGLAVGAGVR
jgi:hypothetical protein